MVKTRFITFRVTKTQFEKILFGLQTKGFVKISDYMMYLCFDKPPIMDTKIIETHKLAIENNHMIYELLKKVG